MPKERQSVSIKPKRAHAAITRCFCTVAQTAQFFDIYQRPGNVHDSNGASQFMMDCFEIARSQMPGTILESRMDSAFFNAVGPP